MTVIDTSLDGERAGRPIGSCTPPTAHELAMMGHDLRAALQGVLGGIRLIEGGPMPRDVREHMARVSASAEVMAMLISRLLGDVPLDLHLTRAKRGDKVEIARLVECVKNRWISEARQKGLAFHVVAHPDAPSEIAVDVVALVRVVTNLIGNSMRHCHAGAVEFRIARSEAGGALFRVIDTGPGIAADRMDILRREGGLSDDVSELHGLGLRIVHDLTAQIGGALRFDNRPGGGLEAALELPAELCLFDTALEPEKASEAGLMRTEPAAAHLAGVRILLAEDNPTNQMVATQMLRALRAEVEVACDGAEALEMFEAAEFDLVVVDIEMPRISGLDVIRKIRARADARANTPIVALTAYALREHQERISKAGANGLISKPIGSIEALGVALAAHLPAAGRARPAEEDSGEPVFDPAVYDALVQTIGADLVNELMEKVAADLTAARADLIGALEPLERGPVRAASHILISVAGAVGAQRLQSCARANAAAHTEVPDALAQLVRRCLAEIDAAVQVLAGRLGNVSARAPREGDSSAVVVG